MKNNEDSIEISDIFESDCRCIDCMAYISPGSITEWEGYEKGRRTAICPACGKPSVVPPTYGDVLSDEFLYKVRGYRKNKEGKDLIYSDYRSLNICKKSISL